MKTKIQTKLFGFRLSDELRGQLEELSKTANLSTAAYLRGLIKEKHSEFKQINGFFRAVCLPSATDCVYAKELKR